MSNESGGSIRAKIGAGLATALLVLVVGAASYVAVGRSGRAATAVAHTDSVLIEREKLLSALKDAETGSRGYLLTRDTAFLEPFNGANKKFAASLDRLRKLTSDNPVQQRRLDSLESFGNQSLGLSSQLVDYNRRGDSVMARLLFNTTQSKLVMDYAQSLLNNMERDEEKLLAQRSRAQGESRLLALTIITVGTAIAFLLSILINRGIRRDVIAQEQQQGLIQRQSTQLKRQATELEKQLRQNAALLESTTQGFYGMDKTGHCTFINPAGAKLLGYEPEELLGKQIHETLHYKRPDGSPYPLEECPLYNALQRGEGVKVSDEVLWAKDGSAIPVEYSSAPLIEAGELRGSVVAFTNITERIAAERMLRENEARKDAVLRSTLDAIIAIDVDGRISEFNRSAEEAFGYKRADIIGKKLDETIIPERFREAHRNGLQRYLQTGEVRVIGKRLELPAMRADGSEFLAEVSITVTHIEGAPAFTGVVRDITEWKKGEIEREQLIKALAKSNEELDQFAYVASHDLKAPLRGIANLSQWVEEDLGATLGGEGKSHMELLRGRVNRMEALIDGILQYSRAGRMRAKPELVDVGALVHDVIELIAPPKRVEINVMPGIPTIETERVPLQQVFINLIGNAVKHAGSENPRIDVTWESKDGMLEFAVADNGQGIAPQYHERIFAIFQTLEARDRVEGTGIGLSVVKKIVESHGGRVWVESEVGEGSTFRFLWPCVPKNGD